MEISKRLALRLAQPQAARSLYFQPIIISNPKDRNFVLSPLLNPQYTETIKTYFGLLDKAEIIIPEDIGAFSDPSQLAQLIDKDTALVLVQYPDFLGNIYDLSALTQKAHEQGALVAVSANPIALGLLKPPADYGVDFVIGEGQPLGIPLSFGGPYLGFFATRKEFVRKISGRIVGKLSTRAVNAVTYSP